jgi:DNA repair protein RadC
MKKVTMYHVELVRDSSKLYDIDTVVNSSIKAGKAIREVLQIEKWHNEKFGMLCLDNKNKIIGVHIITEGTVNESPVYVREIATRSLLNNAVSVIIFHNHPGDDPNPSKADIEVTKRTKEGLKTIGIKLLDHIILTSEGYTSLAEQGLV